MAKKKKAAKKKTTRRKKNEPSPEELWLQAQEDVETESPIGYNMASSFVEGVVIEHPKFGMGIVTEVHSNKIGVIFKEGSKFLVHNRDI